MIDWQQHFGSVFFKAWENAGFPNQEAYINTYVAQREHQSLPSDWIKNNPNISPEINGGQLFSVYGFGNVIGSVFSDMFGLTAEQKTDASDWCGRFNLGISLFDFIADEQEGIAHITSLPVFETFLNGTTPKPESLTTAQRLLSKLTAGVLEEFEQTGLNPAEMKPLFEAELFLSLEKMGLPANLEKVDNALFLKSAEPFSIMAGYVALQGGQKDETQLFQFRKVGTALGRLFWIMDDAKDIWTDLNEGHWNIFLVKAARLAPALFHNIDGRIDPHEVAAILKQHTCAAQLTNEILGELVEVLSQLHLSPEIRKRGMGLIGASLWQWLV